MYDGDEYGDQLLGDPSQLDNLIEARDLNPSEDEQHGEEVNEADEDGQEKGDDSSKTTKTRKTVVRNPQPKLDAVRLTGPRGIATLEGFFRDIKFLGHGYEEQDLKRVMERLELWGNRLYPKFQFDDVLAKVEKLGLSRKVMNYVTKIRMGIETEDSVAEGPADVIQDIGMDSDEDRGKEAEQNTAAGDDLFSQLIQEQLSQIESQKPQNIDPVPPPAITDEQRQRMLQNRRLAEERKLARLKAQEEKASADSTIGESTQVVTPSEELITIKPPETSVIGESTQAGTPSEVLITINTPETSMIGESTQAGTPSEELIIINPPETVDEAHPVFTSDKTEQNLVMENADGSVDMNDAVVSTTKEQEPEEAMEISTPLVEEGD